MPPEIHSASLNSGPGPGSLLAAAVAWHTLSSEYAALAEDLTALVSAVHTGAWDGPSGESYAAANSPYVAWLAGAANEAAAAAAQLETAAGAYAIALASMPNPVELAANHAAHAVMVATNFFGINTIPIAVNEADYVRMWIQAATTMSVYQAVSEAAVAATPTSAPAPTVLKNDVSPADTDVSPERLLSDWEAIVQSIVDQLFGTPAPPGQIDALIAFFENPSPAAFSTLLFAMVFGLSFDALYFSPVALLGSPLLALGGLAGFAGLGALARLLQTGPLPDLWDEIPGSNAVPRPPAGAVVPGVSPPGTAAPTSLGTTTPGSAPTPLSTSAPAVGSAGFGYLVAGAGPDDGEGPTLIDRGKSSAPAAEIVAAAAAPAQDSAQQRSRRRRRTVLRDFGDEHMDLDAGAEAPPDDDAAAASNRGAGSMGFSGTLSAADRIRPEGLIALVEGFDGGPSEPKLPQTWSNDQNDAGP